MDSQVEVFKAWQQFAIYSREQRKKKQALNRQALSLFVSRSLSNYFTSWKHRAKHSRQVRLADQLFHTHMLTKGFRALQWSLSQSKHQYEKLQTKVNTVMVKATFFKWLTKAKKQRHERIENALKRWRLFVMDTQKIRRMRQVVNSHIILCVIRWWNQLYHKKRKQNLAGTFYRSKLLKYSMKIWKQFVVCCQVKARKKAMAISHHNHVALHSTFTVMKDSFCKARKANQHFWHHYMMKILKAWKAACQVCQVEREADMAKSKEHWDKKTVQWAFFQWHEMLLICKARRIYNFKTYRKSFTIWFLSWKENIAYRQKMELMIQRKQMHRALLTWRQNVVQIKRRHRAAILLLESCHLKQTWKTWLTFTIARKIIKKKILDHILIYKRKKMVSCFSLWRDSFLKKQEEENAKRVWSEACVRKLAFRWRHICHKRKLSKIYKDTQPLREHRKCQIIFHQWLCSLERLQKENEEAKAKEKMLQLSLLQRKFRLWQTETQRVLRIKPMVLQRQQQFCLLAFLSWRKLVQQKTLCKQRKQVQQLSVLRSSFLRWKRQLYIHQVENKIKQRISQGLLLVLIDGWKYFIFRKKKGQNFRDKMLVKRMFYFWKEKANSLSNQRIMDEEERENNMDLQRWCFSQWLENVRTQVHLNELHVSQIFLGYNAKHLNKAFCTWRRQMQSTLIARAYHKSLQQRVLVTLFSAWREVTSQSMTDAVHIFSEKIGLQDAAASHQGNSEELMNIGNDLISPINSTHLADSESERFALLSGGLQASMQHRVSKCHRLKSHVTQVITRLRHWPLCVAFDQWREFTEREVQLKSAAASVSSQHSRIQVLLAFREWRQSYLYNTRAQSFRDAIIKRSVLEILYRHREDKKYKKNLSKTAMNHCMKITFNKYFPLWLEKAQDLRQKKHVLLLWSTRTAEEMELLPLETQLTKQLRQRSLNLYFSIWALKYRAAAKIRQVYHQSLLKWVFTAWQDWAKENHCMMQKCQSLLHTRRTRMAFSKWCERLKLFREVDRHHKQAWHNYLHFILLSWRTWAKSNQQLHSLKDKFIKQNSSKNLNTFFYFWKSVTEKLRQAQRQRSQKHQHSCFREWHELVIKIKAEKEKVFQFQVYSYTLLVKHLFYKWKDSYNTRLLVHEKRQVFIEQRALRLAIHWKEKAQTSRGLRLKESFEKRQASRCLHVWKLSLTHIQSLYTLLDGWSQRKNTSLFKHYLRTWKTQLITNRARKLYTYRVLYTVMTEWRHFIKLNRERRIRGLALKKALQERSLHVYFQYWIAVTRVKMSVQQNVEMKLLIRVFRSWRNYSHKHHFLRQMQSHVSQHVNMRILEHAFMNMRLKAEYCTSLTEVAEQVLHNREQATMRAVIVLWKDRLNAILASRCYKNILVIRVVRRWEKFIQKKQNEREHEKENWDKAIKLHNKFLCKKAILALKEEMAVVHQVKKKKQLICDKYAKIWKNKVDLSVTAVCLEQEFVQKRAWIKWRLQLAKVKSINQITRKFDHHTLSQAFKAWKKLCTPRMFQIPNLAAS